MATPGYRPPDPEPANQTPMALYLWCVQAARALHGAFQGKINVVGEVTFTTGTTTTLEDPRLAAGSALFLDPLTADAAGVPWYALETDRLNGSWTLRHPAGSAGRTYRFAVLG